MELQGYCTISKNADCKHAMLKPEDWQGKDCRVMEFNQEGDVLAVHPSGNAMGMFDKKDICRSFRCSESGDVLTPPNMHIVKQMIYVTKVHTRKGGYNQILKSMVIQASLMRGKFIDSFLFALQ